MVAKGELEKQLGEKVVNSDNRLNYEYIDEKLIEKR